MDLCAHVARGPQLLTMDLSDLRQTVVYRLVSVRSNGRPICDKHLRSSMKAKGGAIVYFEALIPLFIALKNDPDDPSDPTSSPHLSCRRRDSRDPPLLHSRVTVEPTPLPAMASKLSLVPYYTKPKSATVALSGRPPQDTSQSPAPLPRCDRESSDLRTKGERHSQRQNVLPGGT